MVEGSARIAERYLILIRIDVKEIQRGLESGTEPVTLYKGCTSDWNAHVAQNATYQSIL